MNTHDKYELPPLPNPFDEGGFYVGYSKIDLKAYARTAIEPYAKRIVELEADRQRRGEPVAYVMSEDEVYEALYDVAVSHIDSNGISVIEPDILGPLIRVLAMAVTDEAGFSPQPAEPVKGPSDESLDDLADEFLWDTHAGRRALIRAALARYGAQPASIIEQIAQQWDGCVYEAAGAGDLDIGEAIRTAAHRLRAQPAASAEPVGTVRWRGSPYPSPSVDWIGRPPEDGTAIYAVPVAAPVAAQPQVRCNHCGWSGEDADLVRDIAADEPDDGAADVCPKCRRIGGLMDLPRP